MTGDQDTEYDDDAASLIQVAISPQQSRLVSPKTPLLDKVEALQRSQGLFAQVDDLLVAETETAQPFRDETSGSVQRHDDAPQEELELPREDVFRGTQPGHPIQDVQPRHANRLTQQGQTQDSAGVSRQDKSLLRRDAALSIVGSSTAPQRSTEARSVLRDGFTSRRRASSGPERVFETVQKAILSIPKKLTITTDQTQPTRSVQLSVDTTTDLPHRPQIERLKSGQLRPQIERRSPTSPYERSSPTSPQLYRSRSGRSALRRSFSDDSLAVSRTFSQASSLGDDTRFEHVQNQVNSRLKAIKDTWQDTSIKLPSLSALKPELFKSEDSLKLPSLASLKPDFLRSHASDRSIDSIKPVDPITRQPFHSAETLQEDIKPSGHKYLDQALATLEGDVVVLGGYRGSILRSAKPPHKQLWVPIKVGLNLRKVDLEVGIEEDDDHKPADDVISDGMLKHIGPVDISARLLRRLRSCTNAQSGKLRVHDYGYDWRLDPTFLSKQLLKFVSSLGKPVIIIAHSLGGLITRHAINQRPELFSGVVYAGVPTRCVNILGPLRNGDDVLLSSRVLTAQVNFTIRTSFALLPLDGRCFIDKNTHEEYRIDFFDPATWREHRLSPCISRALPSVKLEGGIASYMSTVAKALPLPNRKSITGRPRSLTAGIIEPASQMSASTQDRIAVDTGSEQTIEPTVSTAVTLPPDEAYRYLSRTLANVKRFKQELAFRPELIQSYPPTAAIYGKNTPTVVGARVTSRDAIKRADAYDDLAFASGDGVVLARAAMLPQGYTVAKGGLISSERGHVSLLADLDAVGRALIAVTTSPRV